ncbi:MAG: hydrogenase [Thermoanaerobaculia bacterium]
MFPDRGILRAGFVLLILAMLTGLAIPATVNPKMALASHLTGLLGALILMALAVAWPALSRRALPAKIIRYCFISSAYANWIASALGSMWGTRHFTPLSGGGFSAAAWQEALVAFLQVAQAAVVLIGSALAVYELGPGRGSERAAT